MAETADMACILLIRHGEKPADNTDPHLSDQGRARAAMLAAQLPALYPAIAKLYATAPSRASNRPFETIAPLATALGLSIHNGFADKEYAALAAQVLQGLDKLAGKTVVICWHHEKIPALARDGFGQTAAPATWDDSVYDQIWQIDFVTRTESRFAILPQPSLAEPPPAAD
jgi:phosphohistidine phosphatase SixA